MSNSLQQTPIAIIGLAGIFPEAKNLREYWDNIIRRKDCITDVPSSRWLIEDYYDSDPNASDKTYAHRGGFIPDIEFDPLEFGLPPNVLEVTDVSQLLGLVVAKAALKDAGYDQADDATRESTGVILGVGGGQKLITPLTSRLQYPILEKVLKSSEISEPDRQVIIEKYKLGFVGWDEAAFPGLLGNVIAGRIANRLDLGGINCVVDAACAGSLSALKMAISELLEHRSDMMITGGVDTDNSIFMYMCFSKTPALSRQQITRPFDANSDGMMLGEGVGMLVLKRLADAERDGDRIYAVIRGIGTSSDGRYRSIYAPRAAGQALALRRAYEDAGYSPTSVGLIEAHGTGTVAGDPIEVEALKMVFGENNNRKQHIALGSVKSQIGHTKATAGAASLIKAVLALHHNILPPTINITQPNPSLEIEDSPFYLNTETRPWLRTEDDPPRRAGVSSFGFGGTNFHVSLEEYQAEPAQAYRLQTVARPILLTAETPDQLLAQCRETARQLQTETAESQFAALVEATRSLSLAPTWARLGFVAESAAEAGTLLQTAIDTLQRNGETDVWEHPNGIFYRRHSVDPAGKVVALFPGQGSQYLGMGRTLSLNFPQLRQTYHDMDRLFKADNLKPLSKIVFPKPAFSPSAKESQAQTLRRTEYAQPAIGVFSLGLYRLLQQAGFAPDLVTGHSFGELTALWAAGVLNDGDFLYLAKARGQAMAAPDEPNFEAGSMLAVKGNAQQVQQIIYGTSGVTVANINAATQTVLAGATPALKQAQQQLETTGYTTVWLPVSAAFHTPLVEHAQRPFAQALESITFKPPQISVYANSSGQPYPDTPNLIKETLAHHVLKPVLFQQQVENLYAAGGRIFVEIGPKRVLTQLVKEILRDRPHLALAVNANIQKDSDRQLREAVVQLRVAGLLLRDFDPYADNAEISQAKPKHSLNIRLNGSNYTSEKTKMTFENALQDGHQLQPKAQQPGQTAIPALPAAAPPAPLPSQVVASQSTTATAVPPQQPVELELKSPIPTITPSQTTPPAAEARSSGQLNVDSHSGHIFIGLEQYLKQFHTLQSEVLQIHQQFLDNQHSYTQTFSQLTQQQTTLLTQANTPEQVQLASTLSGNLTQSMMRFHDQQAETLRVHEQYLKHQMSWFETLVQLVQQQVGLVANNGFNSKAELTQPPLPQPSPYGRGSFASPPVGGIEGGVSAVPVSSPAPRSASLPPPGTIPTPAPTFEPVSPPVPSQPNPAPPEQEPIAAPTAGVDVNELTTSLLDVVSDKTGYPVEMLEADMDMEADLGIDSIKRVEILGAMQDRYPDLPRLKPEELAELRTLDQIVGHIETTLQSAGQTASNPTTANYALPAAPDVAPALSANGAPTGNDSAASTPLGENGAGQSTPVTIVSNAAFDMAEILQALLDVVSDKTGYPVEMLEADMDMEADLGIDSIKRVEILGAMQDRYPDLPRLKPEELAELRTLDEVTGHIGQQLSEEASPPPPSVDGGQSPQATSSMRHHQVRLKPLPAPDFLEFQLPAGHICLITDDGGPTTLTLAYQLLQRGYRIVLLSFPQHIVSRREPLPPEIAQVRLQDMSEMHLRQQLAAISTSNGPVGAFIHLNPAWQEALAQQRNSGELTFLDTEEAVIKHVYLIAKHLMQPLKAAATKGRAIFLTVTQLDGQFGLGQGVDISLLGGGLNGLTKSLNLEWEPVFCRTVDLSQEFEAQQAAYAIIAEMHDPNRLITEVGYSRQGRMTLVSEEVMGS